MDRIRQRPHRLPDSHYVGKIAVVFTACTANRQSGLHRPEIAERLIELLADTLTNFQCHCAIYCIMPDHIYVMVVGDTDESNTKEAFVSFKHRSGMWLARKTSLRWQENYWDHIVRYFEGWESQARYIALNPMRKGLAETVLDWPYTGSIGCSFGQMIEDAFD
jgi:putative transposase